MKINVETLILQLDKMDRDLKKDGHYNYWLKKSSHLIQSFGLNYQLSVDDLKRLQEPNHLITLAEDNEKLCSALTELLPSYDGSLTPKTIQALTYLAMPYTEAWHNSAEELRHLSANHG